MTPIDWTAEAHARVVCDIGQLTPSDRKALDRAVRSGSLTKWRGHWFPVAGAGFGLGPLKTCYGTPAAKAAMAP